MCIGLLYSLFMFLLSGCMDDRERNYSIGQQFVTTDNRQCLCGNGGSISCGHTGTESSRWRVLNYSQRVVVVNTKM